MTQLSPGNCLARDLMDWARSPDETPEIRSNSAALLMEMDDAGADVGDRAEWSAIWLANTLRSESPTRGTHVWHRLEHPDSTISLMRGSELIYYLPSGRKQTVQFGQAAAA